MTCLYPDGSPLLISSTDEPIDAVVWCDMLAEDCRRFAALERHATAEGISMAGVFVAPNYDRTEPSDPWVDAVVEAFLE